MSAAEHTIDAPIRRYITVLRRRVWVFVAFLVFVPSAAVGFSLSQSKRYEAGSTVLVNRQSVANQLSGSADIGLQQQSFQQVLVTQSRLARTPDVLRATLKGAGPAGRGLSIDDLRNDSVVTANADSDLLAFAVTRGDRRSARRLVLSYANAFVRYRRNLDSIALNRALKDVDAALDRARLDQSAALVERLTSSRQQLETRLALQTANAQVVAGPEEAVMVRPRPARAGMLGLVLGLVMGLAAAFLRDALDTRVHTSAEAEALLDTPVLSRIPRPSNGRGVTPGLAMLEKPTGVHAEAFRILRSNLRFGLLSSDATVVMVTSSTVGEGKSTTISNLAVAQALGGKRVALVELDLRRPKLASLFQVSGGSGLTSVALGQLPLADALKPVDLQTVSSRSARGSDARLDLLTAGQLPPDPSEFINTDAVRTLIRELREGYDLVLIDAPPLVSVSDTAAVADLADAIFVCVRLGLVRRPLLTEFRRSLSRLSIPVLGQVITGAEIDDLGGYSGYYVYGASTPGDTAVPPTVSGVEAKSPSV